MINYYAVAWKVFEHETLSGVQNVRCIRRKCNLFRCVIRDVFEKKNGQVLTVHAEVRGRRGSRLGWVKLESETRKSSFGLLIRTILRSGDGGA